MSKATQTRSEDLAKVITAQCASFGSVPPEELAASLSELQDLAVREAIIPLIRDFAHEIRPCRSGCGAEIAMVKTAAGSIRPYSLVSGLNHFIDCPNADQFRARKKD